MSKIVDLSEGIKNYCKLLSIKLIGEIYEKEAEKAAISKISYQQYLYNLLKIQSDMRIENSIKAKIKKANFGSVHNFVSAVNDKIFLT